MALRNITFMIILFFAAPRGYAETLVTDLSQREIEITSRFAGSELLLFGAI
jgi:hypothetical protein